MTKEIIVNWRTIIIALLSLIVVFGFKKISAMYLIIGGSILGYLLTLV